MTLLIDGDTVLVKSLFAVKGDKENEHEWRRDNYYAGLRACDFTLDNILSKFDYPPYVLGLGGSGNFRKQISSDYKANRDPSKMPKYMYDAKNYLCKYWNATIANGMETDDLLAIEHDSCGSTIIIGNDKDYKQLGGKIYNYWKNELLDIDNPAYYFWLQMLVGDAVDNIEGLKNPAKLHHTKPPNFTEATASEVLKDKSPSEMKETVQSLYKQIHGNSWFQFYDTNARLLFLRRKDANEYYQKF